MIMLSKVGSFRIHNIYNIVSMHFCAVVTDVTISWKTQGDTKGNFFARRLE